MSAKSDPGRFFEDFALDERIVHRGGRTISEGDCAVYLSLTGDRFPLYCDASFAQALGYRRELVNDLLVFHIVFGKTVPDISRNAVANLGYAEVFFLEPVHPGDTLHAESTVIGKRENRNGSTGIVYVRTRGTNQSGDTVLSFCRWVMVPKRDVDRATGENDVPELASEASPEDLEGCADGLSDIPVLKADHVGPHCFEDYEVGDRIVHGAGMTLEEAEHASATRLYQNTAGVHFDAHRMHASGRGKRLVYGGHIISLARALSHDGLENAWRILAWNAGTHANPTHAGDTLYAVTEVTGKAPFGNGRGGALRLTTYALKNHDPGREPIDVYETRDGGKRAYNSAVVLDLDYYVYVPSRQTVDGQV